SKTVRDEARPLSVRSAVLELAGERGLAPLRPAVKASVEGGPPLDVTAWQSLAALDGEISPDAVALLFERKEPALRALAVRHARGTPTEAQVATAVGADPAPRVRVAAIQGWCAWHGIAASEVVEPALFDAAPEVRGAAAECLGGLGETLVPRLEELALARTGKGATGPLLALRYAGPEGMHALDRMEQGHPDPGVRKLATFIAGKPLVDH
ncbi:MAG: HEAT repeat domain-containing protein, partial [Myxococcota bacterium]